MEMPTDARAARTAAALRDAVLRLASTRPIDTVTAVELAAEAGVTRRTLYNHAPSPQALLVGIVRPELDVIAHRMRTRLAAGMPLGDAWTLGDADVAAHVHAWQRIYGAGVTGPSDHLSPSLAHVLSDSFEQGAVEILTGVADLDAADALVTARFVGHGIVGAIEAWLLTTDRDPQRLAAGILRSVPSWVSGADARPSPRGTRTVRR